MASIQTDLIKSVLPDARIIPAQYCYQILDVINGKKIDYIDMEVGHKNKAHSKGGRTTLANSVCLCHGCNKRQGTDNWATFLRKQAD